MICFMLSNYGYRVLILLAFLNAQAGWCAGPLNVRDYGARGDGSNVTAAFRSAIAAAKAAGGGTVYVPPGVYECGPIELVSNLVLRIDAGATVRFPAASAPSDAECDTTGLRRCCRVPGRESRRASVPVHGYPSRHPAGSRR